VIYERTFVGLDVHARSVVACGIDAQTGEVSRARLTPDFGDAWRWLQDLPGPVAVAYEAGPTGLLHEDDTQQWQHVLDALVRAAQAGPSQRGI
jgi:hypothetical protein